LNGIGSIVKLDDADNIVDADDDEKNAGGGG
jgi:hypothetical protein